MDPDENLRQLRNVAARILGDFDTGAPIGELDGIEVATLVFALDEWICKGGALPAEWALAQARAQERQERNR